MVLGNVGFSNFRREENHSTPEKNPQSKARNDNKPDPLKTPGQNHITVVLKHITSFVRMKDCYGNMLSYIHNTRKNIENTSFVAVDRVITKQYIVCDQAHIERQSFELQQVNLSNGFN